MNVLRDDFLTQLKEQLKRLPAGQSDEHDLDTVTDLLGPAARARLSSIAEECKCAAFFDDAANKVTFKKGKY